MDSVAGDFDDEEINLTRVGKELAAGGLSGVIGVIVGLPFDIVKVRMQVNPEHYKTGMQTLRKIVKKDGFFSLYRGMMAPGKESIKRDWEHEHEPLCVCWCVRV